MSELTADMAKVATDVKADVAAPVSTAVGDVEKELTRLETVYNTRKSQLVAVLTTHMATHQKAAAAHATEIAAAQAVLAKAFPATVAAKNVAEQGAEFILSKTESIGDKAALWLVKHWRYPVLGAIVAGVVYAVRTGLLKF